MDLIKHGFIFKPIENWTLKAVGNRPEREMVSLFMFDLEVGELIELKMSKESFDFVEVKDDLYSSSKTLNLVSVVFDQEMKGLNISLVMKAVELDKKIAVK